jgi:hypothetical protein
MFMVLMAESQHTPATVLGDIIGSLGAPPSVASDLGTLSARQPRLGPYLKIR